MSETLRVRAYAPADLEAWDGYVKGSAHSHFGQLSAWMELTVRTYGVSARYWLAEEAGRVRGVLPLFRKGGRHGSLFSAPGGLLADDAAVAEALLAPAREEVARERLAWVELRDQRVEWPGLETSREHLTMVLDLGRDASEQWSAFDAKLRNQIRKGEKAGDDPWDAWTLEWATTSPPAEYNFEKIPEVRSRRPLWDLKHPEDPDWKFE